MNKGYTLIELLGVIIILSILTLLVIPNVVNSIKRTNSKNTRLMDDIIISSAKLYMSDYFLDLQPENGFIYCLPLTKLVDSNYLDSSVKYGNIDDATGIKSVRIIYNNIYTYSIVDTSICATTNHLMLQNQMDSDETYFLDTDIKKNLIEKIEFVDDIDIPEESIGVFDVSELQNDSIKLWYLDENSNGLYEIYIGSDGSVIANSNSRKLFSNLTNVVSIDLTYLDTSEVVSASYMFNNCNKLTSLILTDINTSNIVDMSHMFHNCSSIETINASSFITTKLNNTSNMFYNTSSLTNLDLSSSTFVEVNKSEDMFRNTNNNITIVTNSTAETFITSNINNSEVTNADIVTN